MLINFRFDNFLSFSDLNTFSLVKGKTRTHSNHIVRVAKKVEVLKFSTVYGANGAGKSSFIKAIRFSQQIITKNTFANAFRTYSRLHKGNRDKETNFEFELGIGNKVYSYGFSLNISQASLKKEWLYEIDGIEENLIYSYEFDARNLDIDLEKLSNNPKDLARLKTYIEYFKELKNFDECLFLFYLNDSKSAFESKSKANVINTVFAWFDKKLEVISADGTTKEGLNYLNDDNNIEELVEFLKDFGTGINDVCFEEISLSEIKESLNHKAVDKLIDNIKTSYKEFKKTTSESESESEGIKFRGIFTNRDVLYSLKGSTPEDIKFHIINFKHFSDEEYFSLGDESDGTVRLLELYSILYDKRDKTYFIDELDRSLHPNLTYTFIKKFLSKTNNSQLIVSTHEDRLLDLNILRRDEIWFVEKDKIGNSQLYSLEQFKTRFDKDIMNAYLEGRYGSVPKFSFFK